MTDTTPRCGSNSEARKRAQEKASTPDHKCDTGTPDDQRHPKFTAFTAFKNKALENPRGSRCLRSRAGPRIAGRSHGARDG